MHARSVPASGATSGLVGMTAAALQAEFGPPRLLRRDGPAEVWLYRSSDCTLDLILYPDSHTGIERVAVADLLPQAAPAAAATCLAALSEQPNPPAGRVAARR